MSSLLHVVLSHNRWSSMRSGWDGMRQDMTREMAGVPREEGMTTAIPTLPMFITIPSIISSKSSIQQ